MKAFNHLKHCSLGLTIFFAALALASCSKGIDPELIDNVPPTASTVVRLNLSAVLSSFGCPVTADGVRISDKFSGRLSPAMARLLNAAPGLVDLDELILFSTPDGLTTLSFRLKDPDRFARMVTDESGVAPSDASGFRKFVLDDEAIIAVRGNLGWLTNDFDALTAALKQSGKKHFGQDIGLYEYLSTADGAIVVATDGLEYRSLLDDNFLCANVRLNGPILSGELFAMGPDGKRFAFDSVFDTLDTDFLRYVPESAVAVVALGNFANKSILAPLFPPQYKGIFDQLQKIDGTTSAFAVPAGSASSIRRFGLQEWNLQAMTHMPQADVDKVVEMLRLSFADNPSDVRRDGNQWAYSEDGTDFFFGNFDGYLTVATNRRISADYNNSFTDIFAGKRAALLIDVPLGSDVMKALSIPYGFHVRAAVEAYQISFRLRFYGTDAPVLEAADDVWTASQNSNVEDF